MCFSLFPNYPPAQCRAYGCVRPRSLLLGVGAGVGRFPEIVCSVSRQMSENIHLVFPNRFICRGVAEAMMFSIFRAASRSRSSQSVRSLVLRRSRWSSLRLILICPGFHARLCSRARAFVRDCLCRLRLSRLRAFTNRVPFSFSWLRVRASVSRTRSPAARCRYVQLLA